MVQHNPVEYFEFEEEKNPNCSIQYQLFQVEKLCREVVVVATMGRAVADSRFPIWCSNNHPCNTLQYNIPVRLQYNFDNLINKPLCNMPISRQYIRVKTQVF